MIRWFSVPRKNSELIRWFSEMNRWISELIRKIDEPTEFGETNQRFNEMNRWLSTAGYTTAHRAASRRALSDWGQKAH